MDRRLPAIIAIALIASTIISFFVFERAPEESVTIIRNTAPEMIRRQVDLELTHTLVLGLVARERLQKLEIVYSFLLPSATLKSPADPSIEGWQSLAPEYATLSDLAQSIGFEMEVAQGELAREGKELSYALIDLGEALAVLTHPELSEDATTIHLLISEDGKAEHWTGKDGLYYHRSQISRVTISRDEWQEIFASRRSGQELQPGERPIEEAPSNGRITFVDIAPDEAFSILLELDGRADQPQGSLSLIRIYADGELAKVLANFMT